MTAANETRAPRWEVSATGSLAFASFSLRLPMTGRVARWSAGDEHGRRDPSDAFERLFRTLRESFGDPDATLDPGAFDVRSVGAPLSTRTPSGTAGRSESPRTTDRPRALHPTAEIRRQPAGFEVRHLKLPPLFAEISSQGSERTSWDPVLLGGGVDGPDGNVVNPNDTIVVARSDPSAAERDLLEYLAVVWGQRRSYLFAPALATRIHNVFLPVGLLERTSPAMPSSDEEALIVAPIVTLVASPMSHSFRRVVTLSLVVLPVRGASRTGAATVGDADPLDGWRVGRISEPDLVEVAAQWDWSPARARNGPQVYELSGTLARYLALYPSPPARRADRHTFRSLAETLLVCVGLSMCTGRAEVTADASGTSRRDRDLALVEHEALESLHIAKTSLVFAWVDDDPNVDPFFAADELAASFTNLLFSTVRRPRRDVLLESLKMPESPVPEGAFTSAYYLAPHSALVHGYAVAGAESRRRGPVWMLSYLSYLVIALSAIRASLLALHRELDQVADSRGHPLRTAEALVELEEVFDLQFAVKAHKAYYEDIRSRDGSLADYAQLVREVSLLRDEATLRRAHEQSRRLLVATALVAALTGPLAISSVVGLIVSSSDTSLRAQWGWAAAGISIAAALVAAVILLVDSGRPLWRLLHSGALYGARAVGAIWKIGTKSRMRKRAG